ncbi:PadR family transcriptional regulator [Mycobacterium sp. CBMA293]|uniref:PadR family transcriptional regulator n=2 Tax=Mycolicibacterium TaxID=1866885 RepID=UPI0012DCA730|nr:MULTISPECIES: PadR family transcriptional regulator [unclassified Mycolicibacterium]MUL48773.1 PadR family transcriptional regulator [Mycolicibacterium sp. CBMA 360]MUL62228.1 PadR family transcriptional regulator [Mycolicibacterium sp. CBMA 335]MUL71689.1 PadR family transcriptional regulator [Mycolicibacterium sp. CBMA 311]MUL93644.1 PadR family transcriptional regulator [Mycolicibacterium sp. CBMA 230]MUM09326.1 PadR family transcriptional regulator [Mycolicibacterium sp. CBMA 213]
MKLELLLLGILGVRPATGYELKKFFDNHGRFLRSNTQMSQVYRALARMSDDGWVRFEIDPRPGPQDAKTYHVTPEGMTVFLDWLTGPYQPPSKFTDPEFAARLSFAGFMTEQQVLELIEVELDARRDQVARFRDRDRTFTPASGFPFDHELATAIGDRLHQWGNEAVDRHIEHLELLREELLDSRLREKFGTSTAVDGKQ